MVLEAWFGYLVSICLVALGGFLVYYGITMKSSTTMSKTSSTPKYTRKTYILVGVGLIALALISFLWNSAQARGGKALYRGAY